MTYDQIIATLATKTGMDEQEWRDFEIVRHLIDDAPVRRERRGAT